MVAKLDELVGRARDKTGLSDLGQGSWVEGLQALLAAVRNDVDDSGSVAAIEEILVDRLVQRLRIEAWWSSHDVDDQVPMDGPLVVFGLPRTGTTALHHMMSLDPQFRFLRSWEVNDPIPLELGEGAEDPRRPTEAPRVDVRHIVTVDGPAEDGPIHALAFDQAELVLPVPSYTEWWRTRGHQGLFEYHERFLRMVAGGEPTPRWLLKFPAYSFLLEEMAAHYPTATFVMTHRDPVAVIASTCSVVADSRRKRTPAWSPDAEFGPMLTRHWADGMDRAMRARGALGEERFIDVSQHELEADPSKVIRRVYSADGLTLSGEVAESIAVWAEANKRGSRGAHAYSLEEYGLDRDMVLEAFETYVDRFAECCGAPGGLR